MVDGLVVLKECVNIVYCFVMGDVKLEVELLLKLFVVGDYILCNDDILIEEMKLVNIDKDNFNDVFKVQKFFLDLIVFNKFDDKVDLDVVLVMNMSFEYINDFMFDVIVDKVFELCQMIVLWDVLKVLKGLLGNIFDFCKKVQELIEDEGVCVCFFFELGIEEK